MIVIGVLLAAGFSRRFGDGNKLLSPLAGRPLVAHAAQAMRGAGLDAMIAVTAHDDVTAHLAGFRIVPPDPEDDGQAASLRAGVREAEALGADRIVVALGDMPNVTPEFIRAVVDKTSKDQPAAASDGARPMPPACFPKALFPSLLALKGDQGAGRMLRGLESEHLVQVAPDTLVDVDRVSDIARIEAGDDAGTAGD